MQRQGFKSEKNGSRNSSGQRTVMEIVMTTVDGGCRCVWGRVQAPYRPRGHFGSETAILGVRQFLSPSMAMHKRQNHNWKRRRR